MRKDKTIKRNTYVKGVNSLQTLTPITPSERIGLIDIIRGFAIFGIYLVNMQDFYSPWTHLKPGDWWKSPIDLGTQAFIDIFAQANFYTLFSFLFGFGMVIFKERAMQKNDSFVPLFSRRLIVLLGLGVIHAFFIWSGDILIPYALIGFLLLLFHNARPKTLMIWAFILIAFSTTMYSAELYHLQSTYSDADFANYRSMMAYQALEIYQSGTYTEITNYRIDEWLRIYDGDGFLYVTMLLLPMFLLGAAFAKKKWLHDVNEHKAIIKKIWVFTLFTGVFFKLLPYLFEKTLVNEYLQDALGGQAVAIFYATSITLLIENQRWRTRLSNLAYIGRLSISNYLFQSVLSTLIFYNYGLGFYGKVTPFIGLLLTILIFFIQIPLSKLWLTHFRIGPVEWVWRSLTYKSKQPLRNR